MKSVVQPVKGTRDFYPDQMAVRTWMYQTIREVTVLFGYEEYDAPILERVELYAAKSGEELVNEQAFVFKDRGGDAIALRPELTPSLARMVAQRQRELTFPLRWWSFGPFWRYERPQKGRTREFFQWNIDMVGADSPEMDAELVAVCATFFRKVGLSPEQIVILVNSRRLMEAALLEIGIPAEQHVPVFRLIDRKDKMKADAWVEYAAEIGLSQGQLSSLENLLTQTELWERSEELKRFFAALDAFEVREYVQFEPQIVRGLDYYTGIIFEGRDRDKEGRAILGGGRYDNLVSDVGGDRLPGVGFAMGDVMLTLVLQKYGLVPKPATLPDAVLVTIFDESRRLSAIQLASDLRRKGVCVVSYPEAARLDKQLRYADKLGIRLAVIRGPDEEARGEVAVKNLLTREQFTFRQEAAAESIRQLLAEAMAV
jgi:histidyl-tRNA synthetase